MAKKPKPEGKKYNFMDTYGDLVTLLMCFFVLLFAMSTVEEEKYNAFVSALSNRFGNQPINLSVVPEDSDVPEEDEFGDEAPTGETISPNPSLPQEFVQLYESIMQYAAENDMEGEVSVEMGESGVIFIRLSNNLLFAGNSFDLLPGVYEFLDFLGGAFNELESDIHQVQFLGHTAAVPGSGMSDWILSGERAGAVADYFENTVGFNSNKMEMKGYGRKYPIGDNQTPEGLAMNRRVDIIVIGRSEDPATFAAALAEASHVYFPSDSTEYFEGDPDELPGYTVDDIEPGTGESVDLGGLPGEAAGAPAEGTGSE